MTYDTPKLLLVGAAQDLVLGVNTDKVLFDRNADNPGAEVYQENSPFCDDCGW